MLLNDEFPDDIDGWARLRSDIPGIEQARHRARGKDQMFIGRGKAFAIGIPIALVLCIGPPTLAVVLDLPELMLGVALLFLLPLADLALAVTRGAIDATKRRGSTLNSEFALVVAAQFVHDGGDAERLVTGVPLDDLLPRDAEQLRTTMYEAALRQKLLTTGD